MTRGVRLIDTLRTERMVHWYLEEQKQEFYKTMLIVASNRGIQDISKFVNDYTNSMFPNDTDYDELIKKHQDVLAQESQRDYNIVSLKEDE